MANPGIKSHRRDRGRMWIQLIQNGQRFPDLEGQHFSSVAAVGQAICSNMSLGLFTCYGK